MIATNKGIYVAITNGKTDFMNDGTAYLKVFKLNESNNKFEQTGSNVHTGFVVEPSLSESNGNIYVSYTDFSMNNKVFIKKYENNTWKNIDGINLSASRATIKASNNKLYLGTTPVLGQNSSQVHVYENNKWTKLGEDFSGREAGDLVVDVNKETPYVAYVDNEKGCSIVKKFDGNKWIQEGLNVSDEKLTKLDFKISNNKAYVAINPIASQKLLIKSRNLEKSNTEDKEEIVAVSGVTLNKTSLNLVAGDSENLVPTISPSNATNKNVKWTSSNTNVATVDTTGKVTAVSAGSATITVKTIDGNKIAKCNVTVKNPILINDINEHWAESTIRDFISNGYINGYSDNTFRPNNSITRAEFIKIFNKYFGLNKKSGKTFNDTSTHWAKDEIDIAVTNGVINGYPDNTFKPDEPITREQAAKVISNYKKIEDNHFDKLNKYKDALDVSDWAKSSVEGALEQGYMNGYDDNTFKPKNNITRAEAVVTLSRIKK